MSENNNIIPINEVFRECLFNTHEGVNFLPEILNQADYFGPNVPTNMSDGQCLAVSVAEVMQAKLNLASLVRREPAPPTVSVQNLVDDMTPKPPGYPNSLFTHLHTNGIIVSDQDYRNAPMRNDGNKNLEGFGRCRISGYQQYYCGQTTRLQSHRREEAINDFMNFGPLVGEMNVTHELMEYSGGIIRGNNYVTNLSTGRILSHAATIIGFGVTTSNERYWIMRNNWGAGFGDNGIFRITMDLVTTVHSIQL